MYQYIHGGDIYSAREKIDSEQILDFSANTNPLGLPAEVKSAIIEALEECSAYPDPFYRQLAAELAEYENIPIDKIFCSNGASEIIYRLALAVKPQKALLLAPTFADYERALKTVSCDVEYYFLDADNDFIIGEDVLSHIDEDTEIVFICNPNNPTGQLCEKTLLKKILTKCQDTGALLVVDECFMDFVDNSEEYTVQDFLKEFSNLLILKAFTKIYAMAGIRLGYALTANSVLHDRLRDSGQDWSVSTIAQAAGIAALKQKDYIEKTRSLIKTEREFLCKELNNLGFQVYGSQANYIFFKTEGLKDLDTRLFARGILIRSCSNYVNLNNLYYRVAVRKREENVRLINAIGDVLTDESNTGCNRRPERQ